MNRHHELTPRQSIISMFYRANRRGDPTPNDTRHAMGAATLLRQLAKEPNRAFECVLGMSPVALAECAEAAHKNSRSFTGDGAWTASTRVQFRSLTKFPREAERIAREKRSSIVGTRASCLWLESRVGLNEAAIAAEAEASG